MHARHRNGPRGFTLVELLVVILIIALISAVALPVVLPALNERKVSEAARLLQAILAGTRDSAIRANAPRGIRLLPDPVLSYGQTVSLTGVLAMNRLIPIEPGPDYTEGLVNVGTSKNLTAINPSAKPPPTQFYDMINKVNVDVSMITLTENIYLPGSTTIFSDPTSWYWNIRQGDKLRFNDSGQYYTIAGPMNIGLSAANTDRFVNNGFPNTQDPATRYTNSNWEILYILNGQDDDNDGFVDEAFDGLDNDGDGIVDPMFNGIDDNNDGIVDNEMTQGEYENETLDLSITTPGIAYTIFRRPVVSPGAREVTLPSGVVIDLTTWNAATASLAAPIQGPVLQPERSRLPVDPYTYYVDIMIDQNGQVVQGGAAGSGAIPTLSPRPPISHFITSGSRREKGL